MNKRFTQRKGDVATSQAIATFTKLGFDVSVPITESAQYDIVVDDYDGNLKRVQVKYSSVKDVDLRCIHSNSKGYVVKKNQTKTYDWLYVYVPNGGEYLYKQCFINRRSLTLSSKNLIRFLPPKTGKL